MKVLLVSYAYATTPLHLFTGSQRAFSFVKYLTRLGFKMVVVSHNDASNLSIEIDKFGERIYRFPDLICLLEKLFAKFLSLLNVNSSSSTPIKKTLKTKPTIRWHKRFLYIPDRQIFWAARTVLAASSLHRNEQFDVILTTSPSESVHIVGYALKKMINIPWVADMRDGWMYEPFLEVRKKKGWRQGLEYALERFLLARADSVTTVTQPLRDDLIKRLKFPKNKTFLIPNGFDEEEHDISDESLARARRKFGNIANRMLMLHMGRLSDARKDIDIAPFFQALRRLKASKPDLVKKLSLYLVGTTQGPEIDLINQMDLNDIVHFYPMVPKSEAIAMLKVADVLLLVTSVSQKSIATSKLFDYMAADKPVLALAKGNAAARIVKETDIGLTVSPINISAISEALMLLLAGIL